MRSHVLSVTIILIMLAALIGACASPAPTVAPTKPAVTAATVAPTVATAPTPAAPVGSAPTAAPAATKPAAASPTSAAKVKRGGTLTYAFNIDTPTWDPVISNMNTIHRDLPVLETLLNYILVYPSTGKHELQAGLAEAWEVTDPKTITLKLRKGVKFHDGSDFTAEALNHPKSAGKRLVEAVQTFEVVDPSTLRLKLKEPSAIMIYNLTFATGGTGATATMMVSKAAFDKGGDDLLSKQPPGTGQMQVVDWKRDQSLQTKRFDGYWKKGADGQPLPYLDAINAKFIPDAAVIFTEMRAGTVDVSSAVGANDYGVAEKMPDLGVMLYRWAVYSHVIGFNQKAAPWGDNLKLRQAALYAIDKKTLSEVAGSGLAEPNDYLFWGPGMPGYDTSLPAYRFDLAKSQQLMQEAGMQSGVDVTLSTYTGARYTKPAEIVQSMLAKVGIKMQIDVAEMAAQRSKLKLGTFQLTSYQAGASLDPLHYARAFTCDGSGNFSNYCNPEMDECMAEGDRIYDAAGHDKIFKRCQKILYDDALIGGLHREFLYVIYNKKVQGLSAQTQSMDLSGVWLDK